MRPAAVSGRSVTARVPRGAKTGKPKVIDQSDAVSTSPKRLAIVSASQIPNDGGFKLKKAEAHPHKAFFAGKKKPRVHYTFSATGPTDVRIKIKRLGSGKVIDGWTESQAKPNTENAATWDGKLSHGKAPANGPYKFQIAPASGGDAEATSDSRFRYYRFKFPIRGHHSYGDGVGAPRQGHRHQGQDLPAACGTPLVAVRGGKVQYRGYQGGGAGNYVVIDGKKTGHDYVYMHMKRPARVGKGERVKTGETVGLVGSTGDSSGCHLHFEEWSSPGWYEGGRFLKSVTKHLRQWDSWS